MKWMRMFAAVMVVSALAFGAAGCAKKEEATPEAAAGAAKKGGLKAGSLEKAAEETK